jgi:hypothetical protein
MIEPIKQKYEKSGPKVVEALKKRHFDAYYVSTKEEALKKALEIIPENHSIGWGGSLSIDGIGLKEELKKAGHKMIDRDLAKTPEERNQIMLQSLGSDTFLMSSNAITEDGQLFNIDGIANRVAALCFGPKSVVIIAGMNKVVPNLDAAYHRVRGFSAPANAQRFQINTPCKLNGECANCISADCICNQFVTTRNCKPAGRIKVILVGEDLGM